MNLEETFGSSEPVVGMVHLPALPGAPEFAGDRSEIRGRALADALALVEGGCDALLVENYGDAPYYPDRVPRHTVAEMTAVLREFDTGIDHPLGVNVLRNNAEAAVAIAAAGNGSFLRVNVHTGARVSDQGLLEGSAHETLRLRERIDADVALLADVAVKHSAPASERDVKAVARETVDRGLADGLVVSGPATGKPADADELADVLDARDDATRDVPVFVGSGVTQENARDLLDVADGLIVGTALKVDGETKNPVDERRVDDLVETIE